MRYVTAILASALALSPLGAKAQTIIPEDSQIVHLSASETSKIVATLTKNKYRLVMSEDDSICKPVLAAYQESLNKIETDYRHGIEQDRVWKIGDDTEEVPLNLTNFEETMPEIFKKHGFVAAAAVESNLDVRTAEVFNDGFFHNIIISHDTSGDYVYTYVAVLKDGVNPTHLVPIYGYEDPFHSPGGGGPYPGSIDPKLIITGLDLTYTFSKENNLSYPKLVGYLLTKWPNLKDIMKLWDPRGFFMKKPAYKFVQMNQSDPEGNKPFIGIGTSNVFVINRETVIVENEETQITLGSRAAGNVVVYTVTPKKSDDVCYIKLSQY